MGEEQKHDPIIEEISLMCQKNKLNNAIFLALDPESGEVIIWWKGSKITCAKLTAYFTRTVKMELMKELET